MAVKKILLLNGPNLNLLGTREPHIYGYDTLASIESSLTTYLSSLTPSVTLLSFQTNWEGALIDRIHEARTDGTDAIVINPGAFTHYSIALRDALAGVDIPFVEVHISNVHKREEFRHKSFLSDKAEAVICGLGVYGYRAAVEWCVGCLKEKPKA
ncbi:putative 3-dehydroquinate dehydratase protein [Botrytis fragariae]|uniref:Catabolic 3-dehydroquinase n=1 Tax=Botrytis fragariae TaxID=1964551 RepID=A0A8H6EIM9_9HELO|nr:putative 3-dehydroquinate dehydratase protein [Botrytis fragariae]KAF5873285.1 putative 3-dehydroquinate dehydratase protein [Botrytis fragariae]